MRSLTRAGALLAVVVAVAGHDVVHACAVCFGDKDSAMAKGAVSGVWFMLGTVLLVQLAFGLFFFVYLRNRAKIYRDGSLKPVFRVVKNPDAPKE